MTPPQTTPATDARQDPFRWQRQDFAQARADFDDPDHPPFSQRQYAQQHAIPRSTLGYWLRRDETAETDPVATFFRSPVGESFLHGVVLAALLTFHQRGACGIRLIGDFLQLAQLDRFVGSSYGALQPLAAWLQTDLAAFGEEERKRMATLMRPRDIAVIGDENFHAEHPCLVGIEPVSNFILLETYREHRDSQTWTEALTSATQGLPVVIVAFTSDQAKGLIACAGQLEAQYTPELFHGQRDLARPLLAALQREITPLEKELQAAQKQTQRCQQRKEKAEGFGYRGEVAHWDFQRELAEDQERPIVLALQGEQKRQEQAIAAVRGLADDYHPFDAQTGQAVQAPELQQRLEGRLAVLERVACSTGLPRQTEEALDKGKTWITALVATMAWFWMMVRQRLEEMELPEAAEQAVSEKLLAGLYWQEAGKRGRTPQERQEKKELAERLLQEAWAETGALRRLSEAQQEEVRQRARQIVGLFSRSSSAVEGRNGRLSLLHHGHTRLSEERLKAMTVVHNYVVRRADGSTAAERFFGVPQRDAFPWLRQRMPDLPRPAAKRSRKTTPVLTKAR